VALVVAVLDLQITLLGREHRGKETQAVLAHRLVLVVVAVLAQRVALEFLILVALVALEPLLQLRVLL
jgi:hypothetical protein